MNRILIIFAHPRFEKSRANRALLEQVATIPGVTLHDLYEDYPDFNINVQREQEILLMHDIIIWQHPFYMYGAPALLKQWIDLVLEYGWAHGAGGEFLTNKLVFNSLTSGGSRAAYAADGACHFTLGEFLLPFQQSACLCRMIYLPPFAVQGTYLLTHEDLAHHAGDYRNLLNLLVRGEFHIDAMGCFPLLNDWLHQKQEGKKL